jgi:hypothetical protein
MIIRLRSVAGAAALLSALGSIPVSAQVMPHESRYCT